jgi:hypothetical protein
MTDPLSRAEVIEKVAARFSDLAESSCSPFLRGYYLLLAARYIALEGEWTPAGRQGNSSQRGQLTR